jgi:hypothetical protein
VKSAESRKQSYVSEKYFDFFFRDFSPPAASVVITYGQAVICENFQPSWRELAAAYCFLPSADFLFTAWLHKPN